MEDVRRTVAKKKESYSLEVATMMPKLHACVDSKIRFNPAY